jgi:hypothetical protein
VSQGVRNLVRACVEESGKELGLLLLVVTPQTNTGKKVKKVCAKRVPEGRATAGNGVGGGVYVCVCVFL